MMTIITKKDGTAWMATFSDFVNLHESIAGFGSTEVEAVDSLYDALLTACNQKMVVVNEWLRKERTK